MTMEKEYNGDEFDKALINYCMDVPESYTDYQMKHFVINTAVGDYKQAKQALLEVTTREQARFTIDLAIQINNADIEDSEERLENGELTKHERKILELQLTRDKYDLRTNQKKYKQAEYELGIFLRIGKEKFGSV